MYAYKVANNVRAALWHCLLAHPCAKTFKYIKKNLKSIYNHAQQYTMQIYKYDAYNVFHGIQAKCE